MQRSWGGSRRDLGRAPGSNGPWCARGAGQAACAFTTTSEQAYTLAATDGGWRGFAEERGAGYGGNVETELRG
jgi:hypothetical protein